MTPQAARTAVDSDWYVEVYDCQIEFYETELETRDRVVSLAGGAGELRRYARRV